MALIPLRNLGQYGVNTDVDPLDLPATVFTAASNVRFVDGKVSRGPLFSKLGQSVTNTAPRWAYSYRLQGNSAQFLSCNQNGTVATIVPGSVGSALTYTDVSIAAYTPSTQNLPFTATMLSNVVYINREDRVPWFLGPSGSAFATLTNWDSGWRCKALRSFNGCLVALNVTKGATEYPTMVKTSDFATYAAVPGTWTASLTNSATENVLTDLVEPIIDGWPLRDRFIIYTANSTWYMALSGDDFIYSYRPMFSNYGAISQNCVAEVNNLHFVFGNNDIWTHDGYTPKSLATGRVRNFIFNNLVRSQAYQSFVWANPKLNEIAFCYVSVDPYCAFPVSDELGYPGCNRAAVYNWMHDTWQFYDLPYIVGAGLGEMYSNAGAGITYADLSSTTYETVSGAYQTTTDALQLFNIAIGRGGTTTQSVLPLQVTGTWDAGIHMYAYDLKINTLGIGTLSDVVNAPAFLENIQMDMDEISKEIRGYKVVTTMYPEGRVEDTSAPITFWYGSSDYSGETPHYGDSQTFDGSAYYKLDFNSPGRYLSLKMAVPPTKNFSFSAMDIDFKVFGHR